MKMQNTQGIIAGDEKMRPDGVLFTSRGLGPKNRKDFFSI